MTRRSSVRYTCCIYTRSTILFCYCRSLCYFRISNCIIYSALLINSLGTIDYLSSAGGCATRYKKLTELARVCYRSRAECYSRGCITSLRFVSRSLQSMKYLGGCFLSADCCAPARLIARHFIGDATRPFSMMRGDTISIRVKRPTQER